MTRPRHLDDKGRPVVAVTGLGVVTSLGQGVDANWRALTAGQSGLHEINRFPTDGLRSRVAGSVDFMGVEPYSAYELAGKMAATVSEEALVQAAIGRKGAFPGPLFIATTAIGTGMAATRSPVRKRLHDRYGQRLSAHGRGRAQWQTWRNIS